MMNKCITGKNVYDTVDALLVISTYKKIDNQIRCRYLQKLPDVMAVYSLQFSASAIAVTVVMSILNDQYCRLQYQMRQSKTKQEFHVDDIELENGCKTLTIYYDLLAKHRTTYYNSSGRPGAALIPCKRKCTSSCNDLDLTVENIEKIVNGTILTSKDDGI